jgi:hypothetical protein
MKNDKTPKNLTTRRTLLIAYATALTVACTASLPRSAHADDDVTPPPVPSTL